MEELVVYKTVETPRVLTGNYDGILFFSPSAVKSFFLNNVPGSDTRLFAIGTTTANALKHFAEKSAIIPAKPSKENLVMLAIENFGKSKIY